MAAFFFVNQRILFLVKSGKRVYKGLNFKLINRIVRHTFRKNPRVKNGCFAEAMRRLLI